MFRYLVAGLALLGAGAVAQTTKNATRTTTTRARTTTSMLPTSTSSAAETTHTVAVGATGFKFEPNNITAAAGDTVLFRFYPGNHGVARSDFSYPCIPYELTGVNHIGFFSKLQNPQVVSSDLPTFSVRVNDTQPIWFYCPAPGSCKDQHMIGVINPNSTQTLEKQEEFVKKAQLQLAPGEAFPSESESPTSPKQTTPAAGSSESSPHLGPAQIAGIAIGGTAVVVLAGALLFICGRKSRGPNPTLPSSLGGALAGAAPNTPRMDERTSLTAGAAADAKRTGPQSPGQTTFATAITPYSAVPAVVDPYRAAGVGAPQQMMHPQNHQYAPHPGSRTPPFTPGSFVPYHPVPVPGQQTAVYRHGTMSPVGGGGFNYPETLPGQNASSIPYGVHGDVVPPPVAPVELSAAPRSPPLPPYQSRRFSFVLTPESATRPWRKP